MRRKLFYITLIITLLLTYNTVSAYMVNPYYAINSSGEYNNVKNILNGNSNQMYFSWGRITRNNEDRMVFTSSYNVRVSQYDKDIQHGFPGDVNLKDYKSKYPQTKVLLSVFFNSNNIDRIDFLNSSKDAWDADIIQPMIKMLDSNGFDGLVLDFEGFRNNYNEAAYTVDQQTNMREKYNNFIDYLKVSLAGRQLVVCVHPTNVSGYYDGYDLEYISQKVDYVILMAYDYQHGIQYTEPQELKGKIKTIDIAETQPFYMVEEAVKKLIQEQNLKPEKLILGLSLSPVKWVKCSKNINGNLYTYYEMSQVNLDDVLGINVQEEPNSSTTKVSKKVISREQALAFFPQTYGSYGAELQGVEYYFESPTSIFDKYQTILSNYKLAGVSVWRLGLGDNSISIWESLMKLNAVVAPSSSPTQTPIQTPDKTPTKTPAKTPSQTLKPTITPTPIRKDTTPPSKPTVNSIDYNDKTLTGKAEVGAVIIVKKGTFVVGTAIVDSKKYFSVKILPQKAGTVFYITAKDKVGNTSGARKVTVIK